jgi:DNA-binding NtrC family response regulator
MPTKKPTVLVVDDEESIREIVREHLAVDCNVLEAGNGMDALSAVMVADPPVDLVVTDLKMGGIDGLELAESLPEGLPFILISGYLRSSEYEGKADGVGAAAVLEKPLRMAQLREAVQEALGGSKDADKGTARVLLIDDEEAVRTPIRTMLEKCGHDVDEAADGQDGIDRYHARTPDIIIVDMFMPTKSGLEVIQEVLKGDPKAKIIAISGFGIREEPDMVSLAKRYGAVVALEKPFHMKDLVGAVERLIGKGD